MGIGLLSARLIQNFRNFAVSVVQNRTSLVNRATVNPVLLSSMHDENIKDVLGDGPRVSSMKQFFVFLRQPEDKPQRWGYHTFLS